MDKVAYSDDGAEIEFETYDRTGAGFKFYGETGDEVGFIPSGRLQYIETDE